MNKLLISIIILLCIILFFQLSYKKKEHFENGEIIVRQKLLSDIINEVEQIEEEIIEYNIENDVMKESLDNNMEQLYTDIGERLCSNKKYYHINPENQKSLSIDERDNQLYILPESIQGNYDYETDSCYTKDPKFTELLNCENKGLDGCMSGFNKDSVNHKTLSGGVEEELDEEIVCKYNTCFGQCKTIETCWKNEDIYVKKRNKYSNCKPEEFGTFNDCDADEISVDLCPEKYFYTYDENEDGVYNILSRKSYDKSFYPDQEITNLDQYECKYTTTNNQQRFETEQQAKDHCKGKEHSVVCHYRQPDGVTFTNQRHYLDYRQCTYDYPSTCILNIDDSVCTNKKTYYSLDNTDRTESEIKKYYLPTEVKDKLVDDFTNNVKRCVLGNPPLGTEETINCSKEECYNLENMDKQEVEGVLSDLTCLYENCYSYEDAQIEQIKRDEIAEAERLEQERIAREKERLEQERREEEERQRAEAERERQLEEARIQREKAEEEARIAIELAEEKKREAEEIAQKALEAEQRAADATQRAEEEKQRAEEEKQRAENERIAEEEKQRAENERIAEEEKQRALEATQRAEEAKQEETATPLSSGSSLTTSKFKISETNIDEHIQKYLTYKEDLEALNSKNITGTPREKWTKFKKLKEDLLNGIANLRKYWSELDFMINKFGNGRNTASLVGEVPILKRTTTTCEDGDFSPTWKYVDIDGVITNKDEYVKCEREILRVKEQVNTDCKIDTSYNSANKYDLDPINDGKYRIERSCNYFENKIDDKYYPIGRNDGSSEYGVEEKLEYYYLLTVLNRGDIDEIHTSPPPGYPEFIRNKTYVEIISPTSINLNIRLTESASCPFIIYKYEHVRLIDDFYQYEVDGYQYDDRTKPNSTKSLTITDMQSFLLFPVNKHHSAKHDWYPPDFIQKHGTVQIIDYSIHSRTINGLQPNTEYQLAIMAKDSSFNKSFIIFINFKTPIGLPEDTRSSSVSSTPVEPTPVEPTPVEPIPVEPIPVEPIPVEPTPTPIEPTPERITMNCDLIENTCALLNGYEFTEEQCNRQKQIDNFMNLMRQRLNQGKKFRDDAKELLDSLDLENDDLDLLLEEWRKLKPFKDLIWNEYAREIVNNDGLDELSYDNLRLMENGPGTSACFIITDPKRKNFENCEPLIPIDITNQCRIEMNEMKKQILDYKKEVEDMITLLEVTMRNRENAIFNANKYNIYKQDSIDKCNERNAEYLNEYGRTEYCNDSDFDCEWKYVDNYGNLKTREEYIACDDEIFFVREQKNTNCKIRKVCDIDIYYPDPNNSGKYRIQTSCKYFDKKVGNRFYAIGTQGNDIYPDGRNITYNNCLEPLEPQKDSYSTKYNMNNYMNNSHMNPTLIRFGEENEHYSLMKHGVLPEIHKDNTYIEITEDNRIILNVKCSENILTIFGVIYEYKDRRKIDNFHEIFQDFLVISAFPYNDYNNDTHKPWFPENLIKGYVYMRPADNSPDERFTYRKDLVDSFKNVKSNTEYQLLIYMKDSSYNFSPPITINFKTP
jgi:hypothetical protein